MDGELRLDGIVSLRGQAEAFFQLRDGDESSKVVPEADDAAGQHGSYAGKGFQVG